MRAAWRWLCELWPNGAPMATRVGLLNTGELVLVSPCGQAQVLSSVTTYRIRRVLGAEVPVQLELRTDPASGTPLPETFA